MSPVGNQTLTDIHTCFTGGYLIWEVTQQMLCSHERFQDFRDVFIFIPGDVFTMGFFVLQNLQKPLHPDFLSCLVFFFSPTVEPSTFSDAIALPVAAKGNTACYYLLYYLQWFSGQPENVMHFLKEILYH